MGGGETCKMHRADPKFRISIAIIKDDNKKVGFKLDVMKTKELMFEIDITKINILINYCCH